MGMIYKRGQVFWIKYYCAGRPIRESTGTTKQKQAERFLKHREGRSAAGLQPLPRVDRITYDELARDLRLHYETTGTRGLKEADTRFKALQPFFAGRRVANIKGALAEEYVQYRLKANVAPATVNRELATFIRMLRLGYERDKVAKLPVIHKLTEAPPRAGFFARGHHAHHSRRQQNRRRPDRLSVLRRETDAGRTDRTSADRVPDTGACDPLPLSPSHGWPPSR